MFCRKRIFLVLKTIRLLSSYRKSQGYELLNDDFFTAVISTFCLRSNDFQTLSKAGEEAEKMDIPIRKICLPNN